MNLKTLVLVLFSSFGMSSSSHPSSITQQQQHHHHRRGSLLSHPYAHHGDAPAMLPSRQLMATNAISKNDLCSDYNLGSLEDGLGHYFLYWLDVHTFYDDDDNTTPLRYHCHCDDFQKQQQGELIVSCRGQGISPVDRQTMVELQDTAIFRKVEGGNYVLKTTWWADSHLGNINSPQEVYRFNDEGRLDSCEAQDCVSCSICDSGVTVEVDCLDYHFSCNSNYTGGFLNQYDFVPATEEEQIASSGEWPLQSPRTTIVFMLSVLLVGFCSF